MNSLVCLALLGVASAAILPPLQQVPDTADVAAAKARFFQLYKEQAALAEAASDEGIVYGGAQAPINSEGHVVNTDEVQNAINAFNAAYQAQLTATAGETPGVIQHQAAVVHQAEPEHMAEPIEQEASFSQQYSGPYARVNADGSIQDTAEVEAAAKAFFEAYNAQLALARSNQEPSVEPSVKQERPAEISVERAMNVEYNGPFAPINAEGDVENTAEVKAAALAFFEAYERQLEETASDETSSMTVQLSAEPLPVSTIVVDEAAAWAAHLLAFKHALATTGDSTAEAQLAKDALLQAYMEVSQRDHA